MENDKKRRSEWTNKKLYIFITDEPQKGIEEKAQEREREKGDKDKEKETDE